MGFSQQRTRDAEDDFDEVGGDISKCCGRRVSIFDTELLQSSVMYILNFVYEGSNNIL